MTPFDAEVIFDNGRKKERKKSIIIEMK